MYKLPLVSFSNLCKLPNLLFTVLLIALRQTMILFTAMCFVQPMQAMSRIPNNGGDILKLSLAFLKEVLHKNDFLSNSETHLFENTAFYTNRFCLFDPNLLNPDQPTLFFCFPGCPESTFEWKITPSMQNIALIWVSENTPPHGVNALWIPNTESPWHIFNQIESIFHNFHTWEIKVYEAIGRRKSFDEIFELLNEVTDNPWYFADSSFRILFIKKDPDLEDMSVIWRYMYQHYHLPLYSIISLIESEELSVMNSHKKAFLIPQTVTFNVPFINKTVFSDKGILGHFFILGIYTKLTAYELEIAEFFGNILTQLLLDYKYMPNLGRIYDSYFTDLLEGVPQDTLPLTDEIFRILSWECEDILVFFLLTLPEQDSETENILKTEIHILEYNYPCKAFFYKDQLACIFNVSQYQKKHLQPDDSFLEKTLHQIACHFKRRAGFSEPFIGVQGFSHLNLYYEQAYVALQYCLQENNRRIVPYHSIAIRDFCNRLAGKLPLQMIFHDAVRILYEYDAANGTELTRSLQQYLANEQNTTRTANHLFIHRNTLLYRLDTIKELTKLDLDDPDTRFRLFLSFYLYPPNTD